MDDSVPSKVFLTGAVGFIARALAARYRAAGAEVTGVDLVADPTHGIVAGDIAAPGPWQQALAGSELVIHTAAVVSNAVDLDGSWRVNVLGTRQVVDAATRGGARRLVHFSSVRAFSDLGFPDRVSEDHPVRPDGNPYVDTKIASEQVVLQAHAAGELACTVIRPGDVYGPGSRPWTLLPLEIIRSGRFLLPARGRGVFSPVYIENLVDGVVLAAAHPDAAGQVFTLSDGVGISSREFFAHYFRRLGKRGPICLPTAVAVPLASAADRAERLRGRRTEINAVSMRYLARRGTYSIAKARRMLGYEPAVSLDEGMRRTERWLGEQGLLG
ncbi:MAG TPA: NAD-dependent epimerase/dehydratase family protein [Thermoleophilaceae bacterium]